MHRIRPTHLALLLLSTLLTGCKQPPEGPRVLRLGELLAASEEAPQTLPVSGEIGPESEGGGRRFDVAVDASRFARLVLTARGQAQLVKLSWQIEGERSFPRFRSLSFPVFGDGQEHVYEIDLHREPYWVDRVRSLKLETEGGPLEILELEATPAATPYRDLALRGESMRSLPGLARLEIPLPEGGLGGAVFETSLGLQPELSRRGAAVRFRAYLENGGERRPWLDETLSGADDWQPVRLAVEVPAGSRLVLETEGTLDGEPLVAGAGAWGNPVLVRREEGVLTSADLGGPDVVVVVIDTLRADVLGSYGSPDGLTPNLDALAAESVRFADLFAAAPWTLPSIASLMTGLEPRTHGAGRQRGNFAPTGLAGSYTTLAEVLSKQGFFALGLYHNIYLNPPFGLHQGFDRYISLEEGDDVLVDRALELLEAGKDRRLFFYLHLFGPHNPYEPPEKECREVAARLVPDYQGSLGCAGDRRPQAPMVPQEDWAWLEALYRAEVAFTDRQLGRFFEALEARGRDTVLLVTSDHGEDFWDRQGQLAALGYETNADHGHHYFRELIHVPGLLRLPGLEPQVMEDPAELEDFFPTLLAALGVEAPLHQGRDLLPRLRNEGQAGVIPRSTWLSEPLLYGEPRQAVQRGPYKLVTSESGSQQLYESRPGDPETEDLATRQPDTVEGLRAVAAAEENRCDDLRGQLLTQEDLVSATYLEWNHISKLRALGYLK